MLEVALLREHPSPAGLVAEARRSLSLARSRGGDAATGRNKVKGDGYEPGAKLLLFLPPSPSFLSLL